MRALKFLMIGMGVLIVAAVVTIVVTLYNRATKPTATGPWAHSVALPAGGTIADYRIDGERMVVRVSVAGQPDRLVVVDLTRGTVVGTVTFKNE